MAKLGVGVLGVGEMGKRHAENLRRLVPEARLVAIADVKAVTLPGSPQNSKLSIPSAASKLCWNAQIATR